MGKFASDSKCCIHFLPYIDNPVLVDLYLKYIYVQSVSVVCSYDTQEMEVKCKSWNSSLFTLH